MRIQNVDSFNTRVKSQSFTALKPSYGIEPELFNRIVETPLVKNFANQYNAYLDLQKFRTNDTNAIAISLGNIKPASLFAKFKNIFSKGEVISIFFKTPATNEDELICSLEKTNPKKLLDIYNQAQF